MLKILRTDLDYFWWAFVQEDKIWFAAFPAHNSTSPCLCVNTTLCFSKLAARRPPCTVGNTPTTDNYLIRPRFKKTWTIPLNKSAHWHVDYLCNCHGNPLTIWKSHTSASFHDSTSRHWTKWKSSFFSFKFSGPHPSKDTTESIICVRMTSLQTLQPTSGTFLRAAKRGARRAPGLMGRKWPLYLNWGGGRRWGIKTGRPERKEQREKEEEEEKGRKKGEVLQGVREEERGRGWAEVKKR